MDKKVSILMPMFNNETSIMESIHSVILQTHTNWELIIVDDASTDNSYEIVRNFIESPDNYYELKIKLKANDRNIGCYSSLNEALLLSTGDYITRLDADDTYKPNKLHLQLEFLENNPDKKAVSCLFLRQGCYPDHGDVTLMFLRQVFEDIGFYDSVRFGADSEYFWRIAKRYKNPIGKIKETLYFAKKRKDSLTNSLETGNLKIRRDYISRYHLWQDEANRKKLLFMPYPLEKRFFPVNEIMLP